MKSIKLLVPLAFVSTLAFATSVQKTGTVQVGYDRDANLQITKQISVSYSSSSEDASLTIEDEGNLNGTREKTLISGYVSAPKKYFFYTLNLNPETGRFGDGTSIILERSGAGMTGCGAGANAILTGYKGDGTKKNFCVTLK